MTRSNRRSEALSNATRTPAPSSVRSVIESPKMYSALGALAPYRISLRSSRMISTCRSDTAEKISTSGRSMSRLPSRCIDKTSVPALCASSGREFPSSR
ncbi:Uncharacterised protein [Mycobacteroides abscessus subsp. abscessus]|nr:Uncharacterised protein [Mycobacteroides abscessus subsp. abscessus]